MDEESPEKKKQQRRRTSTLAVIEANKKNALKSTGPKTEEGKERVKYNAAKHGILSDAVALAKDKEEEGVYRSLLEDLVNHLKPEGPVEHMLVEKIAISFWRYRRLLRYEVSTTKLNLLAPHWDLDRWGPIKDVLERSNKSEIRLFERLLVQAVGSIPQPPEMDRILKYQAALERSFYRALDCLERLQRMRKGQRIDEPKILYVDQD